MEEEQKPRTKYKKRTQGSLEAGRVTAHPEVWYSLVKAIRQTTIVLTHWKLIQGIAMVRCWRVCRGPQGLVCRERSAENLGDSLDSRSRVCGPNDTEGR